MDYSVHKRSPIFNSLREANERAGRGILILREPLGMQDILTIEGLRDLVCLGVYSPDWPINETVDRYIHGWILNPKDENEFEIVLRQAQEKKRLLMEVKRLRVGGLGSTEKANELLESALELAEQKNFPKLVEKTLTRLRSLVEAEGASLYLKSTTKHALDLIHVQNEKVDLKAMKVSLPINLHSIAGSCAVKRSILHMPDVRKMAKASPFQFHSRVDEKSGYRTKEVLCFPLLRRDDELVGVVQLINSKRPEGFNIEDMDIGRALSSFIAVTLEKMQLYEDIENLFDGFVRASVTAIESRDPATAGHSERVAEMSVTLAKQVSDSTVKPFRNHFFNEAAIKQIQYAALLHDFGKIAVPEKLLLKQKKLFPEELKDIQSRLRMLSMGFPSKLPTFRQIWEVVRQANEPTVVVEDVNLKALAPFVGRSLKVMGKEIVVLTKEEFDRLKNPKGNLTVEEKEKMQSHVEHTFKFLCEIPWTKDLQKVPSIAYNHHERLDGSGYPNQRPSVNIPYESKILAVCDVYDALTAHDRSYKEKVPHDRAVSILYSEGERLKLDQSLIDLFVGQEVFKSRLG